MSMEDFMSFCDLNLWYGKDWAKATWDEFAKDYEWTDDIPKGFLQVRLANGISEYNRKYVVNGIRS